MLFSEADLREFALEAADIWCKLVWSWSELLAEGRILKFLSGPSAEAEGKCRPRKMVKREGAEAALSSLTGREYLA